MTYVVQHDSLPQQPTNEQIEKLKVLKYALECFIAFLQIPKQSILPSYMDKLGIYEKQIVYIINHNRKPEAPQQHKCSLSFSFYKCSAKELLNMTGL